MSEFRFVNGAPRRMLLVIEPRSSEFWIKSKATVQVLVEDDDQAMALDVEYLPNGLVIYVEEGRQVEVREDGRLLGLDKRSRRLGQRLNGLPSLPEVVL
ncbi:hypothetical protein [Pseudomonas sp. TCU-HL1]|uniref:hypothetical protein n=1 Tax=Pseudomonas sp. TCU-HL1 TaxID=1856685 RepID=UPI00083D7015|nr:hypothetical protein [Pseudomonas sp. TCU-HL1]AOE85523.1 hypothetical protein THL1_2975 [Pseudomonas sp. TCU-HL1]